MAQTNAAQVGTVATANISTAAAGDTSVVAAPSTERQRIRVLGIVLTNGAATANTVLIKDGAGTTRGTFSLGAAIGSSVQVFYDGGIMDTSVGNAFIINLSAATLVTGSVRTVVIA